MRRVEPKSSSRKLWDPNDTMTLVITWRVLLTRLIPMRRSSDFKFDILVD